MPLSNSTTLNDLVGQIVAQDAQSAAYANRVLRPLIRGYLVPPGAGSIVVPRFQSVAVAALSEGVAPSSTTMNTDGVTLTPTERGTYVQISKRALHADPFQDLAPYGEQLGRSLSQDEDVQIFAKMNFSNVIGTGAVDQADFLAAISALEAANAPGPYFAVVHPNTWAKLRTIFGDAATYANVGKQTVEGFGPGFTNMNSYVGSPFGVPTFISTSTPTNGGATVRNNVVFSREAVGCAWIRDIGVDVDDNIVARALDLMAWYSADCAKLVDTYGVILADTP